MTNTPTPPEAEIITLTNKQFIAALKGYDQEFWVKDSQDQITIVIDDRVVVEDEVKIEEDLSLPLPIQIQGGTFQRDFEINGGVFQHNFNLCGGVFQRSFIITGGKFQGFFSLNGGVFQHSFDLNGGVFLSNFILGGGIFLDGFFLGGGTFHGYFSLSGGVFLREFTLDGGEFKGFFDLSGGEFQYGFGLIGGVFQRDFDLTGGNFHDNFYLSGGTFNQFNIREIPIPHFQLLHRHWHSPLYCSNTQFGKLTMGSPIEPLTIESGGDILFDDCTVQEWRMESLGMRGSLSIKTMVPKAFSEQGDNTTSFYCSNSDLGAALFLNVPFQDFDQVVITGTKLNKITTQYGYLPVPQSPKDLPFTTAPGELHPDPVTMAETYNQLHLAMKTQGAREWEYKYLAASLDWQRQDKANNSWGTRFALGAQRWSTRYGQSWTRPLLWILGLGLIFFGALSVTEVGFAWVVECPKDFFRGYLKFLLPTHRFSEIAEVFGRDALSLWPLFLDILGRIVLGFLIYQMIAAFRRFGKR